MEILVNMVKKRLLMSCDKYAHFMVSSATVIVLAILNYQQSLEGFTQGILIILDAQLA